MDIKQKLKEFKYLYALRAKGRAYINFLDSVNEVQKFGKNSCFSGYPNIVPECVLFKQGCRCEHENCPMIHINNRCADSYSILEKTRRNLYQAETAMVSEKVKE